jgi:hypothetical protein
VAFLWGKVPSRESGQLGTCHPTKHTGHSRSDVGKQRKPEATTKNEHAARHDKPGCNPDTYETECHAITFKASSSPKLSI